VDRDVTALRDMYDWQSVGDGTVVDVGGADGSVSLILAKVSCSTIPTTLNMLFLFITDKTSDGLIYPS
jgi:hypothetical protein